MYVSSHFSKQSYTYNEALHRRVGPVSDKRHGHVDDHLGFNLPDSPPLHNYIDMPAHMKQTEWGRQSE